MENDNQEEKAPLSEPYILINPDDELCMFCEDARESLERIMDLFDALDDQCDRLDEPQSESEPQLETEAGKNLEREIRIARTLVGLFAEKAKKLSRRASDSKENLEAMLEAILND